METQKIVNQLNSCEDKYSKFALKKKLLAKSIESSLCDYSDAYVLVTGNITVKRTTAAGAGADPPTLKKEKQMLTAATQVAFKNCAPFKN